MSARRRRQVLIALVVGTVLNAAVYGAYTLPRLLRERWVSSRRAALQEELERERGQAAALKNQMDAAQSNASDVGRFYGQVVGVRNALQVPVLKEVEALAREGGLQPGGASYTTEPIKGAGLERFGIAMPVDGTYRNLVGFIERLERSSNFYTLEQVSVSGSSRGTNRVHLDLIISCYFRLPGVSPKGPNRS